QGLCRRERGLSLDRLQLAVEVLVLGAEAPELLVLGHESFDDVLLRHTQPPWQGSGAISGPGSTFRERTRHETSKASDRRGRWLVELLHDALSPSITLLGISGGCLG